MDDLRVTNVKFTAASSQEAERGLLGWITCQINGPIRLEAIAVRRTRSGRLTLSFPARRDGTGRQRFYFRPLSSAARLAIEEQVFGALGLGMETYR